MNDSTPSIYNSFETIATLPYSQFSQLLKEIPDPPKQLFVRGKLKTEQVYVGIVGSRKATHYSKTIIPRLVQPLVENNCVIVSGLAFGADALAHEAALRYEGTTIAVLAGGVDDASIYPRSNFRLAKEILNKNGCLVSEYPSGTKPQKHQFIARNRIIAGLCQAVVVVECAVKSGALITADLALNFNREVGAVPGPIQSSLSVGPHRLIKDGACLVESGEDILKMLGITPAPREQKEHQLSVEELLVLKCIQTAPLSIDEICQQTHLQINLILPLLTRMELAGLIMHIDQQKFAKT